jgi:hypothetical protein
LHQRRPRRRAAEDHEFHRLHRDARGPGGALLIDSREYRHPGMLEHTHESSRRLIDRMEARQIHDAVVG